MQKVFIYNFDNLINVIINYHEYIPTQNINEADVIVIIVNKNDDNKIIGTLKPLVKNWDNKKIISVLAKHIKTTTVPFSDMMNDCYDPLERLIAQQLRHKFVILTVEIPKPEIQKKANKKQLLKNTNQQQYKQIRQIPKQILFQNRTRCK